MLLNTSGSLISATVCSEHRLRGSGALLTQSVNQVIKMKRIVYIAIC